MNADQIIESIKTVADLQYANEPAQYRLAYHVGLLESHLRGYTAWAEDAYDRDQDTKAEQHFESKS